MNPTDTLDERALESAKRYMGGLSWPVIGLGIFIGLAYSATLVSALTGELSLWIATPIIAVLTYLSYTVFHEAIHGSISGSHHSWRWMNEGLGYMAAWILMIPLTAHRHEHLTHHRHTNDAEKDPDYYVGGLGRSLLEALLTPVKGFHEQYLFYLRERWQRAPGRQNLYFCVEVVAIVLPRVALLAMGYWQQVLTLMVLAWALGLILMQYLFAYVVHRPYSETGRYQNTTTILVTGRWHRLVTWLWLFQNYHSIHHLFPRVPFYHYARLYSEIEPIMVARGAPIQRLTLRGTVPYTAAVTNPAQGLV